MLTVTTYKIKPHITKAEVAELMAVFAKHGAAPGQTAHYLAADGSHGVVIADSDDMAGAYRNILNFTEWLEFETSVMLMMDEAVPQILDSLA